jgi:hypothetical protein
MRDIERQVIRTAFTLEDAKGIDAAKEDHPPLSRLCTGGDGVPSSLDVDHHDLLRALAGTAEQGSSVDDSITLASCAEQLGQVENVT